MGLSEESSEHLKGLAEEKNWNEFRETVKGLHPYDLAEIILELEEELQYELLANLDKEILTEVIPELPSKRIKGFMEVLPPRNAASILEKMASDEMADIVALLSLQKREEILGYLSYKEEEKLKSLLKHPADTAGGIMSTEVLSLQKNIKVKDAIDYIKENAKDFETIYYLFITDKKNRLVGVLSLRELVLSPDNKSLEEVMNPDVIKVPADMDQEDVGRIASDYNLSAIPVVDSRNVLRGIVTIDDVVDVIEEEVVEDMGQLAGTGVQMNKLIDATPKRILKARLPWLTFALIGNGIIASNVLKYFEETLATVTALALFIPVIMTMGGNVGIQSSTVYVRGLAIGQIEDTRSYFLRELTVGMILGIIIGIGVALFAKILVDEPLIGPIVGISMFITMTVASLIGVVIPYLSHSLGFDPAVASSPFITTFQDILGLLIYFGIAGVMLHYFL